ncbi:MAG: complex I NDUFA9 subunit family protein [Rhodothermales bacterium]
MKVLLTGATGFIGSYVLRELIRKGHSVRCLVRDVPRRLDVESADVEQVEGSVTDPSSLEGTMDGCDAVIHLVGIIDERPSKGVTFERVHHDGTKNVVDQAVSSGVPRFIHMSANGARPDGVSAYQTSKWKAEEVVREAGFEHWTIFRPSTVFGDPGPDNPEFAVQVARTLVKPFPILPVFGDGTFEMQPISVEETASAMVQALTLDAARNKSYCTAGRERMTYVDILDRITDAVGHARKRKLRQPISLVRPFIHTIGRTGLLPISPDQFEMLIEGNTCDSTALYADFELDYKPFSPENLHYVKRRS